MEIHAQSIWGYAYLIKNELTGAGYSDDTKLSIALLTAEIGIQFGMVSYAEDVKNLRLGAQPEYSRYVKIPITLEPVPGEPEDSLIRRGDIGNILSIAGKPYLTRIGTGRVNFVPAEFDWQVKARQSQTRKPVYYLAGDQVNVLLTPETVLVSTVQATAIPANPFPADQEDPFYWKTEWNVPLHIREQVVDAVIRKMAPTYWQMKQAGSDKVNNGAN